MLSTLYYLILTFVVIYILGYGVTNIVLPKKLFPYFLWLMPWILIVVLIPSLIILSLLGVPVRISAPILSVILFSLSVYTFYRVKPQLQLTVKDAIIAFVIFMNILFNIIPILRREGILTTISIGNNDVIAYATVADYLVDHSISESFHSRLLLSVDNLLHDGYRWGTPIISSFFLAIFRLSGYQFSYLIQTILFSLTFPLAYVFIRVLYKPTFLGMFLAVIMTAFNANLLYILYNNFFGQVLFWGLQMVLFILFFTYFGSHEEKVSGITLYDYVIALTIATLFFSYHEPAVFMFIPLVLYLLWRFISRTDALSYLKKLAIIGLCSLSISSVSIFNAIIFDFGQTFASKKGQPIGWELFRQKIPYANPFEAMGFYSIHSFEPMPTAIAILLSLAVLVLIAWGIFKARQRPLTVCFTIVFFFFYYWTGVHNNNFYDYNRALTYTLPFFIVLFTIGFFELFKLRYLRIGLITILIGLVMFSSLKLNKKFRTIYVAVDRSFASLHNVPLHSIHEPIYTEAFVDSTIPYWVQNWTGYFIYDNSFIHWPTKFNEAPLLNKVPENSLILSGKYSRWYYPPKRVLKNIVWENEYYRIGRLCSSDACIRSVNADLSKMVIGSSDWENVLLLSGWSMREGDERWSDSLEPSMRLVKKTPATMISIETKALKEPQNMDLFVNDAHIASIQLSTDWKKYTFPITDGHDGVYLIQFKFSKLYRPSDLKTSRDTRTLSAGFRRIILE